MSKFDVDGFSELKIARLNLERLYFKKISSKIRQFEEMPRLKILCGINGGLPFNCLMTDIYSGCKSIGKICYGNCSAAEYWIEKKHNFGRPVLNIYEEKLFIDSVLKLPKSQRWLRQG